MNSKLKILIVDDKPANLSRCYEAACKMALGDMPGASIAIDKALLIHPTLTAAEFFYFETFRDKDKKANLQNLLEAAGLPA